MSIGAIHALTHYTIMKLIEKVRQSLDFKIIAVVLLYSLSAQVGLWLSFPETSLVALWPPSGLALALILLIGYRIWPAIMIGSLIANTLLFLHLGYELTSVKLITPVLMSIGFTLEALFGHYLIRKLVKDKNPFLKTNNVFKFLLVGLLMGFVGAFIYSLSFSIVNLISAAEFLNSVFAVWINSLVSILIITPFIIGWTKKFKFEFNNKRFLEVAIFAVSFSTVIWITNIDSIASTVEQSVPFLIIPFLLWLAFRFNLQIAVSSILIVSLLAVYYTINSTGPFVLADEGNSLLILQIFICIISITVLTLHATVTERTEAQKSMERFNEKLEAKVLERTKELNEEIQVRKQIEEKINISNSQLRKANIELDNFVYSVSHDLRAPIASVLGLVNLAKKESSTKNMLKYVEMIGLSAEQQDCFIKDILDLSRNARLEVAQEEIIFETMINEIFEQLKYSGGDKKVIKHINVNQKNPFKSDNKRLRVIFNNLISNAIRYSNGHDLLIQIGVDIDDGTAKISINDNGKGIPSEHLDKVFKMFYRATDDNAGSGLGLYIVKETVEKLRGNVTLQSEESVGTTVSLEIPNLNSN